MDARCLGELISTNITTNCELMDKRVKHYLKKYCKLFGIKYKEETLKDYFKLENSEGEHLIKCKESGLKIIKYNYIKGTIEIPKCLSD